MSIKKINTIFIGTPDFGIPTLEALIHDDFFDVKAVISQPDKKIGRKQIITPTPIKNIAIKNNIIVWQPKKISNFEFPTAKIDLIVVVAYAQLIPKSILNKPKYGCINVHGSLLPYCRGSACVQKPILDGKEKTGITIMLMDEGLDTGPILTTHEIKIENGDTAGSVFEKLSILGGKHITKTLRRYIAGDIKPTPQNNTKATYVSMLKRDDGEINFKKTAEENERFVRAMTPWPGAHFYIKNDIKNLKNKKIKLHKVAHNVNTENKKNLGELFSNKNRLFLQCKNSSLEIIELQIEGKKNMSAQNFLCGYKI